jgi:hypothetical protein
VKRRSKLSLSPDAGVNKKQAPGFEHAESSGFQTGRKPGGAKRPASASARSKAEAEGGRPRNSMPTWPNGRQVFKAVLVIAATAVSLYLLKRRFF